MMRLESGVGQAGGLGAQDRAKLHALSIQSVKRLTGRNAGFSTWIKSIV
jgi:hypothetical protein